MKLSVKNYKILKTKEYFKVNNLFFFVNGINQNSLDWLLTEQGLKTAGFNSYKLINKTAVKTLNNSIYDNNTSLAISGSTFLIKPQQNKNFLKHTILTTFNPLFFELLVIKFNNKIYPVTSLENTYSFKYKEAKLLFYQFNQTHIKSYSKFSK